MLKDLIDFLETLHPDLVVPFGFGEPHSFRGYYEDVAFTPVENARVGDMLEYARSALDRTFHGYKGGDYTMHEYTDCWISEYGTSSGADKIGQTMFKYWTLYAK